MSQAIKEELIQTLDRLSLEKLLAVLHFARGIAPQAPEQVAASAGVSAAEAERSMADFLAAAGCGHSSDVHSSRRIDEVLYGRQGTP